jgi:small subunit ribosomal protein S1
MTQPNIKALRAQTSVPEDDQASTRESNLFAELFQQQEADKPKIPAVVKGTVVSIREDLGYVIVDIGHKSEGQISIQEFMTDKGITISEGETIEVYAEHNVDDDALLSLSKREADRLRVWDQISIACESDEVVRGRITQKVKGGLNVDINGVKAFLPGSQVDIRPSRNLDRFVTDEGEFEFKVIKFNRRRRNIVLSRRVLLEKDRAKLKSETMNRLIPGAILTGVVKNIQHYGAFIDLGGIDGLLHLTDMSWGRISNPTDVLGENAENTPIEVKVLKFDVKTERVSLGLKQLKENPWDRVKENYFVDQRVQGTVVSLADYGAFLELEEGIEGLIHVSEMSWTGIRKPSELFEKGQQIEAQILDIDIENQRISLGYKQTQQNPWIELQERFHPGSIIQGPIRNVTDFGIFVSITSEIDGLVHISDLSWTQKIKNPSDYYNKGEEVEAVVLNVDVKNQRFSLGIKQLTPDLWESEIPRRYAVGRVIKGVVTRLQDFGAFVKLEEGIEGLIHISELSMDHIKDPREVVEEGQEIVAEVINIDRQDRKIGLTLKSTDIEAHQDLLDYMEEEVADEGNFSAGIGGIDLEDA